MGQDYKLLIQKLNLFIKEYYKNLIFRGCVYCIILAISVLVLFGLIEHYGFFNNTIRAVLFWSYCVFSFLISTWFIVVPGLKMLRLNKGLTHQQAAEIIGRHFSSISDKLTNILELKNIKDGNNVLIEASINQKISEVKLNSFTRAIDWKKTMYFANFIMVPVAIILLIFLSGNKEIIADSTHRIINYNTNFIKPAPFYFNLKNDTLFAVEHEDVVVKVEISGPERPKDVLITYNEKIRKMKPVSVNSFSYTIKNISSDISFYFSANEEYSKLFHITTLDRPKLIELSLNVSPPTHTGIKKTNLNNMGSVNIPEGSLISWTIETSNTDSAEFYFKNKTLPLNKISDKKFHLKKRIHHDLEYGIALSNSNISFKDTIFYNLKIIKDAHPIISIKNSNNIQISDPFITGLISDDYGISELIFITEISGESRDTAFREWVPIETTGRSQPFMQSLNMVNSIVKPGENVNCYFILKDNDKLNNYKSTRSETIKFRMPTKNQTKEEFANNTNVIKQELELELEILANLKKELLEFEKRIINKDSLDWRDQKQIKEIIQQHKQLEKKINQLKEKNKKNFDLLNSISPPSEEMIKKQKELEDLFEEIMPEEMKELYQELEELQKELDKDKLQNTIKDLELSNEDLEKELDRNLEILKQVEFEQQLEDVILELKELSKNQLKLSNKAKEGPEMVESQKEHIKDFTNIQQKIEELKELNQKLENKHEMLDSKDAEKEIENSLKNGLDNLEKEKFKKSNKTQKNTSEKLLELANMFSKMKKDNQNKQQYEDMGVLRQILENLVYFSIKEEDILLKFQKLDKNDPVYVELMHQQQNLIEAAAIIEDSLFALSKRVPQISSKVNREINAINNKAASSINYLRERLTLKATKEQQFVMTAANNLAVLLAGILESMQEEMASDMPSDQQCEKPGQGLPKPGDLKKMQESLNEHLEKLKEEMESGQKNNMKSGMSKKLVEMLARQEMIRQALEDLKKDAESADELEAIENAIEKMKETEEDIANKNITLESLLRQKEIITNLLKVEDAIREQGEDDERESKINTTEYDRLVEQIKKEYELEKIKQTEMIKTTPPSLNNYYKEKIDWYFNLILQ